MKKLSLINILFFNVILNINLVQAFDKVSFEVESVHNNKTLSYYIENNKEQKLCKITIKNKQDKSIERISRFICAYIDSELTASKVLSTKYQNKYKVILDSLKFNYYSSNIKHTIIIPMSQTLLKKDLKYQKLITLYKYLNDVYLYGDPKISKELLFNNSLGAE